MAVFTIADLHLSSSVPKPMTVFGGRWNNYTEKLESEWRKVVGESDTVIIPGDISWAMNTSELKADFDLIEALPGKKLIGKGNHDYWWATMKKLSEFVSENGYKTVDFLYNNAFTVENLIVCGSRGWYNDDKNLAVRGADNDKIIAREVERLKISLGAAAKLAEKAPLSETVAFLHFPVVFKGYVCEELAALLEQSPVKRCFCGHIHGNYEAPAVVNYRDVDYYLISADYLAFRPHRVV